MIIMSLRTLRGLDLNLLVVLHALLETRSATLAAERLNMTQPAVSRALERLRHAFKDRLFAKGSRGLIATPRAEALVAHLTPLMREIGDLLDGPGFDPSRSLRVFRIATSDYGAHAIGPALAELFAREAPNAAIEMSPLAPDSFRRLAAGEFDAALYSDDPLPPGLHTLWLFDETYVTLTRAGHPLLSRLSEGRVTLEGFLDFPHTLFTVMGGQTGVVDEALAKLGKTRRIALWLPYFSTAAQSIARTDMILTLPRRVALPLARSLGLVALDPPVDIEPFGYHLVWRRHTREDAGSVWLRGAIARAAKSEN